MHRPDRKYVNADVLSRHIAAAVRKHNNPLATSDTEVAPREEVPLSKEVIGEAQAKDEFCQQTKQALSEGKV
jgi:hypothetical protein